MTDVHLREGEHLEVAIKRFKRACEKAGILSVLRKIERYIKPTTVRKQKRMAAVKRAQKKAFKDRRGGAGGTRARKKH